VSDDVWKSPALRVGPPPVVTSVVTRVWPDTATPLRRPAAGLAALAGAVAAATLLESAAGVGVLTTGVAVTAAVAAQAPDRLRRRHELVFGVLALLLLSVVAVRDAGWVVALCMLGALGCGSLAVSGARSWLATAVTAFIVPLAGVRGCPGSRDPRRPSPAVTHDGGGRGRGWSLPPSRSSPSSPPSSRPPTRPSVGS
jgi:hypothetical protein